ncbi:ATP-binding protein [Holophaga foetida]|uniref:ATP-binding protein n=1 Tax=Holophaga foetida TaxID=35839 RepID=UPI0002472156
MFSREALSASPRPIPVPPPKDFEIIRRALVDLVHGMGALHEAGIIHRDLKPGNVLITPQGRLVILDFGLATHLVTESKDAGGPAGTPAFIAPEQLEGGECSPASDWYSLGVMLYQVLTGQPPYVGTYLDIVRAKAEMDPCPPSLLVEGLPEDIEGLCMALLERDPAMRPSAEEILSRLRNPVPQERHHARYLPVREVPGREAELGLLLREFQRLQDGDPHTVWLHGEAGSGKSGLVQRFLTEVRRREPRVQILSGRCYEQETVPFKALDSLVDALSTRLKALPPLTCKALFPRHMQALVRLFPVLAQVPSLAELPTLTSLPDAVELRRRAFSAFRELMVRLAKLYPLVLVLEDLQWGDLDSEALLAELFRSPDAPALMLIITFRSDDLHTSPILRRLRSSQAEVFGPVVEIELHSLSLPDSRTFAMGFLGGPGEGRELLAERIARESGGNPFFIRELAYFLGEGRGAISASGSGLDSYIQDRIQTLPEEARELLETVSLAACPVPWGLAREAMGRPGGGYHGLSQLRAFRLIRVRGAQEEKVLEPYHERVRKAVVEGMDAPRVVQGNLSLAVAMESRGDADAILLASHFKAGGGQEKAAHYFGIAGEQAERALAFDQAANLFGEALALLPGPYIKHRALALRHAEALSSAGRSAEAGEAYSRLVPGNDAQEDVFLQRRASEEFMRSGHMDRGVTILEGLLPLAGARIPRTPTRALLSVLYGRLRLKLRGLSFTVKAKESIPAGLLNRIDILWAAAMGYGPVDPIRGADFQARQLLLTLKAGEPFRLVRALAHEAAFLAHGGLRSERETGRVLAQALSLAERMGHPNPMGRAFIGAGIAAIMQGRWKAGAELLDKAEQLLREHCTGLDYEIHIAQFQALVGYSVMGDLPEVARRLPELLQEAKGQGDLLALTNLKTGYSYLLHLAQDDPDRARVVLQESMAFWSNRAFHAQHYNEFISRVSIELYAGARLEALDYLERCWKELKRSMLLRVQAIAITCWELRARTILGLEISVGGMISRRQWRQVRSDIHAIEREGTPYGHALALRLRALEALAQKRGTDAQGFLLQAEVAFEACDMLLHAITARHGRARLQGEHGRELLESADSAMRQRGIQNPGRFAGMHLPFVVQASVKE